MKKPAPKKPAPPHRPSMPMPRKPSMGKHKPHGKMTKQDYPDSGD